MELNKNALAYSATTLAATMMNSIFMFYYVKIFLNVYKISNYWFNVAQIVFLIWNAINDPLFGYFQDSSTWMVLRKRRLAILYGAPLFAVRQVAAIIGSPALLVSTNVYQNEQSNFRSFQAVCILVAFLSWLLMRYTGMNVEVAVDASGSCTVENQDGKTSKDSLPLCTLLKQILTQRSFVCFVAMNFFQVLYSLLTGSVFLVPRLSLPVVVFLAGRSNIWALYFFLIIDNSLPDATFSLFNLSVSDIIDADMEKYHRNAPVSSMIFGTNALFTKPAQSLAPMMVVHILSWYGYKDNQGNTEVKGSSGAPGQLLDAMFFLLCIIPLIIAMIQIVVWTFYPLKRPKKAQDISKILL
ncbi:Transmembrane protein 180 [Stylophora pistillata]|uniref:Transmembrane protein 180 n=1 Tax=Stylophora pistillata TaxID=50429 RepID=A0A2B4SP76_STYPI|nr:Transmembrane protein 180 [Stylophora pistillata]